MANDDQTMAHMQIPQPGDRFQEFYSFWMEVRDILDDGAVIVEEWNPGYPHKTRHFASAEKFRAHYAYGDIPGYSLRFSSTRAEREARGA
jgi:hypothetical protein